VSAVTEATGADRSIEHWKGRFGGQVAMTLHRREPLAERIVDLGQHVLEGPA